jgi:hypothetical protein
LRELFSFLLGDLAKTGDSLRGFDGEFVVISVAESAF